MDLQKIINDKMSNMEMSPNKRKSMSVDALNNADHTSLSIDQVKRKYRSVVGGGSSDSENNPQENAPQSDEDIEVKLIRNKDRSVDANDPVGERTIIFHKGGGLMGSQG